MPSPFPGMNPYLEQPGVWHTVHAHALTIFVERLVPQVVPAYIVKMGNTSTSTNSRTRRPGSWTG